MTGFAPQRSSLGTAGFWKLIGDQEGPVVEYFSMDNAVIRPTEGRLKPQSGRLYLDSRGVHFEPEYGPTSDSLDLPYDTIVSAVQTKESKDTVMIATVNRERYFICVLRPELANGIAGIVRIKTQRRGRPDPGGDDEA